MRTAIRSRRFLPCAARIGSARSGLIIVGLAIGLGLNAPAQAADAEHPLVPFLKLARQSRDAIAACADYEAIFTKTELVGAKLYKGQMRMKFRPNPFSVYLRFVDMNNGREVLYLDGKNGNKLVAHEPPGTLRGMLTVQIDPRGSQAMAEGRHPITEIGMQKMMDALIELWQGESRFGEIDCKFYPDAKSGDLDCRVLEAAHPQARRQFKFQRTLLFIDKKTNFPIRLQQWGFPDRARPEPYLVEEYIYTDIRTNVGLTNTDFDIRNRNYRF